MTPTKRVGVIKLFVKFLRDRDEAYKVQGYIPTLKLLIEDLEELGLNGSIDEFLENVDQTYASK